MTASRTAKPAKRVAAKAAARKAAPVASPTARIAELESKVDQLSYYLAALIHELRLERAIQYQRQLAESPEVTRLLMEQMSGQPQQGGQ